MYFRVVSRLGLSVLLLTFIEDARATSSTAAVPTIIISQDGEATKDIEGTDPLEVFRRYGVIMKQNPLFDSKTQKHSPEVFYDMTSSMAEKSFTTWFFNLPNYQDIFQEKFSDKVVAARLNAINSQDVAKCQSAACCNFLTKTIYGLSKDTVKSMTNICVETLVGDIYNEKRGRDIKRIFDLFPDDILSKYGQTIVYNLQAKLGELKPSILQKVLQDKSACKAISTKGWETILKNTNMAEKITPTCLQQGRRNFAAVAADGLKISNLGTKAFNLYNLTLPPKVAVHITSEQVGEFAKNFEEGEFPGGELSPKILKAASASGLTLRQLLGFLYKDSAHQLSGIAKTVWTNVPDGIFDKLTAVDVPIISTAMQPGEPDGVSAFQALLSPTQVKALINYPELCMRIEPGAIRRNIPITRSCFELMPPKSQAAVIAISAGLPADVLSEITAEKVKGWSYSEQKGLEILNLGVRRSNISAIIRNMGSQLNYDHPCRLVDNLDTLKALTVLQSHMSLNCFENMEYKPEKDHYVSLNRRLKFLIPFETMKETYPDEFWRTITSDTLGMIISGGQFCSAVDVDTMVLINLKAYPAIMKDCLHDLRIFNELPKENIQAFPPSSLVSQTSDNITSETIGKLTPDQLAALGAEVGDEKNPATLFTLDAFNSFGVEHLTKVTREQWKHTDSKVFATFSSEERLRSIQPDNMAWWDGTQVSVIPSEVIVKLSPAQAETIGNSCDSSKSPLRYLAKLALSNEVQQIISRRLNDASIAEETMSLKTILIIAIGILVVISGIGAGIYFMNRD